MNLKALRFGVGLLACLSMVGCRFNTENASNSTGGSGTTGTTGDNAASSGTDGSTGSQCIGAPCTGSSQCCPGFYCSATAANHCLPNGQITSTASSSTGTSASNTGSTGGTGSTGSGSTGFSGTTVTGGSSGNSQDGLGGVRVAVLVPDLAAPLDFCLHSHSSPSTGYEIGPVAANFGLVTGLSYQSVTRYLTLAADTYDIRTVAAGSTDCSTPLANFPDLVPGVITQGRIYQTLVVMGTATASLPGLSLYGTTDTIFPTSPSLAAYRMLNAEIGVPKVDLTFNGATLFGGVDGGGGVGFQHFGYDPVTGSSYTEDVGGDGLTYVVADSSTHAALVTANNISLAPNTTTTMYVIGQQGTVPLKLLVCKDEAIAPSIGNVLAACTVH
jgi:hypothetical protein